MSQTQEQQRFGVSEVAGDWPELMVLQRNTQPFSLLPVLANGQLDLRCGLQIYHHPISHSMPSVAHTGLAIYSFPVPLRVGD